MEHDALYMLDRYRVAEQIEKVKEGYRWRVTAYDDQAAREMPPNPPEVRRFDHGNVAPTLEEARHALEVTVSQMREDLARDAS